jgi:hypothetical protein
MAKLKGIIKIQGTVAGVTSVDSQRYQKHIRAASGTHKKAKINSVFQSNNVKAKKVAGFASPLLKQLKSLERGFAGGDLWSRMNGRMLKAKSTSINDLMESLNGLEVHERYPLSGLFPAMPNLYVSSEGAELNIDLTFLSAPEFPTEPQATELLCKVTLLLYDGKNWISDVRKIGWMAMENVLKTDQMKFHKPNGAKYYLVVMGLRGGIGGRAIELFTATAYKVIGWGRC